MAKAETELNEAVAQAILPPALATSSSDPHGSRQGDVEMETMETPSEAPVATVFMQVDTDDDRRHPDDADPPEYAAEHSATLEEPSMFDTDSATLLSPQVWSVAEKNLESMTAAELEDIKRKTCAEEWRNMVELHQVQPVPEVTGDRQVEGTPMILSIADGGRVIANAMRSYGSRVRKTVHVQAYVCAGIAQTMTRPVVLAFQHPLMSDYPLNYDVPSEWVYPVRDNNRQDVVRSYAKEAARIVFDYAGIALCGSEMPIIELQRDPYFTRNA